MTDIVKKLREFQHTDLYDIEMGMLDEVADEITRLRAENKSMDKIIMSLIDRLGAITSARILQGKDIAELSAKNAELSVEIDRLRAALKENSK